MLLLTLVFQGHTQPKFVDLLMENEAPRPVDPTVVTFDHVEKDYYRATYGNPQPGETDHGTQLGDEAVYSVLRLSQVTSQAQTLVAEEREGNLSVIPRFRWGPIVGGFEFMRTLFWGPKAPLIVQQFLGTGYWFGVNEETPPSERVLVTNELADALKAMSAGEKKVEIQTTMGFPFLFRRAEKRRLGFESSGLQTRLPDQKFSSGE